MEPSWSIERRGASAGVAHPSPFGLLPWSRPAPSHAIAPIPGGAEAELSRPYGGFPIHGGTPKSSSISRWDFPVNKPSILGLPPFWGTPHMASTWLVASQAKGVPEKTISSSTCSLHAAGYARCLTRQAGNQRDHLANFATGKPSCSIGALAIFGYSQLQSWNYKWFFVLLPGVLERINMDQQRRLR